MPVVRRDVSQEVLLELLAEGAESDSLDFKRECDLGDRDAALQLIKDILAMQAHGGFIVIGAKDDGTVVGIPSDHLHAYDESKLYAKVKKFVEEPFEILLQTHELNDGVCALVYVGPRKDGLAVAKQDGHGTDKYPVFRKGDVLVRHGTASERCNQSDLARALERLVEGAKEAWQREVAATWEQAMRGQTLARGPAHALSWQLDPATLRSVLIEQLRVGDEIPLRGFLRDAVKDAKRLSHDDGDWSLVLDAVTAVAAVGIEIERRDVVTKAIEAVHRIYYAELDGYGNARRGQDVAATKWLEIILRVLALGGFAVRSRDWSSVRTIGVQRSENDEWERYTTWVRHALTMASRSNLFERIDGERKWKESLIRLAQRYAEEHEFVRPDLDPDDEAILDSICQFDLLVALASVAHADAPRRVRYYPNFYRFHSHRTEPAAERLLRDDSMRAELFPLDDEALAACLREVDEDAEREALGYNGWDGFRSPRVTEFLAQHPEPVS